MGIKLEEDTSGNQHDGSGCCSPICSMTPLPVTGPGEGCTFDETPFTYVDIDNNIGGGLEFSSLSISGYLKYTKAIGAGASGQLLGYFNDISYNEGLFVALADDVIYIRVEVEGGAESVRSSSGFIRRDVWTWFGVTVDVCSGEVAFWKDGERWGGGVYNLTSQGGYTSGAAYNNVAIGTGIPGQIACVQMYDTALNAHSIKQVVEYSKSQCSFQTADDTKIGMGLAPFFNVDKHFKLRTLSCFKKSFFSLSYKCL